MGTGLGLGAFKLLRLAVAESAAAEERPELGLKLVAREPSFRAAAAGFAAGWGCEMMASTMTGRTNMPWAAGQSK